MPFDPDAFIKSREEKAKKDFDPDAFVKDRKKAPPEEPGFLSKTYDKVKEGIVNLPESMVDLAVSGVKAGGEFLNHPVGALNAGVRRTGDLLGANQASAAVQGVGSGLKALYEGEEFGKAYDEEYDKSLAEEKSMSKLIEKQYPNTTKIAVPAAATLAAIGTGGTSLLPSLGIQTGLTGLDQIRQNGVVDPSQLVADATVGGLVAGAGKATGQAFKAATDTLPAKALKSAEESLVAKQPEARRYIDDPNLIRQAETADSTNQKTQGLIKNTEAQEPGVYNKIAKEIDDYQQKTYEFNQAQYDAMHAEAAKNAGKFVPERNTPGMMINKINGAASDLPDKVSKGPDGLERAVPEDPIVVDLIQDIRLSLPKDLTTQGKIVRKTNPDGTTSQVIEPLTPAESFKRSYELSRMVKGAYRAAVKKIEKNSGAITPEQNARLREAADRITDAFDENLIGDLDPKASSLYKDATETNAINRQLNKAQSKLSAVEDSATEFDRANPVNADKIKAQYNKIDEGTRQNIKDSIAGQQDLLGLPRRDVFSELEANKANVARLEAEIAAQNMNATTWGDLNSGANTFQRLVSRVPAVGQALALTPQGKIRVINALREAKPKLAAWMEPIVQSGRAVNVALIRSIALQSREKPEDVAKEFENLGIPIEK